MATHSRHNKLAIALESVFKVVFSYTSRTKRQSFQPALTYVLIILGAGILASCSGRLDIRRIEAAIQQDIEERGGIPVKTVTCPRSVAIAIGESFQCSGTLSQGGDFTVTATQQDALGNVTWEIPNSKALLNLVDLETYFQQQIATEIGSKPLVSCGGIYRANKPGDQFECRVVNAIAPDQSRIEAIVVKIDAIGNISWQQVRRQLSVTDLTNNSVSVSSNPTDLSEGLPDSPFPAESDRPLSDNRLD
jgi:hypothetical protein